MYAVAGLGARPEMVGGVAVVVARLQSEIGGIVTDEAGVRETVAKVPVLNNAMAIHSTL